MKCTDAIFTVSREHDKVWKSLLHEKPVKISKYIIVQHVTIPRWIEHFQQDGVDGRVLPPDSHYGRVSIIEGKPYQSRINKSGLYIQRVDSHMGGILIAVKQNEIKLSMEAKQFVKDPLAGLYLNEDAVIRSRIPSQRILGATNYEYGYFGEKPGWSFIPNSKCIKSIFGKLARCIHYVDGKIYYGEEIEY